MVRSAGGGQLAAVDADPHHEELVLQLLRLQHRGATAVDAGRALGVQPPPAHPPPQVAGVDAVESGVAVAGFDPLRGQCRPSSSFFIRSLTFSGSRWPSAHWPCPRATSGRSRVGRGAAPTRLLGQQLRRAGVVDRSRSVGGCGLDCRAEQWARGSLRTGRVAVTSTRGARGGSARRHHSPALVSGGCQAAEQQAALATRTRSTSRQHTKNTPWADIAQSIPCPRAGRPAKKALGIGIALHAPPIRRLRKTLSIWLQFCRPRRTPRRRGPARFVCSAA